jgi:hypothetical protein
MFAGVALDVEEAAAADESLAAAPALVAGAPRATKSTFAGWAAVSSAPAVAPGAGVPALVPAAAAVAGVAPVFAAAVVELPAVAAELAVAAVVAASEVFAGPSSARADFDVIATAIMAATQTPLRHPKHVELNRSLIESMPPRKLLSPSSPGPVADVNDCIMTNWCQVT